MDWMNALERRFGRLAIPGLIRIIVGFNALVFLLAQLNPEYVDVLKLVPNLIRHGEVWRLITYIFIPQTFSFIWIIFTLGFLFYIGDGLERVWGAFRLNLYYLLGMIGTTLAAFFFGSQFSNGMLNATLFYAFARFYPEEIIYIFFVLPVKIKWLAWISGALLMANLATGPNSYRMAVLAALINYLLFFGPEIIRDARGRKEVKKRRERFQKDSGEAEALHKCIVCGATEETDPALEFRVARDGEEYCLPHLPVKSLVP